MATIKYSSITDFATPVTYKTTDFFNFDIDSISASDITDITITSGNIVVTVNDNGDSNSIIFDGAADLTLENVLKTYFVFADGSQLVVGDGLSTAGDATKTNALLSTDGSDYLYATSTNDSASYLNATAAVSVDLDDATAQDTLGAGFDKLVNVRNVIGSKFNDTLDGDENANRIDGGLGKDKMDGKNGGDTYIVTAGDIILDTGTTGTDEVKVGVDFALNDNSGVETLTLTGTTIYGTGDNNANTINGNAASNIIDGGAGNDILVGGDGADTYFVDSATDSITELSTAASGIDQVISSVNFNLNNQATNVENLRLVGTAVTGTGNGSNNIITGNGNGNTLNGGDGNDTLIDLLGGDDTLIGGAGLDTLKGGKGNDTLTGGTTASASDSQADTLTGGSGNDTYNVTDASDVVNEAASAIDLEDTVNTTKTYTLNDTNSAGVDILVLAGSAAINGTGNSIDNTLTGNDGKNTLNGGKGNDTIDAATVSGGDDTLIGGDGEDDLTGGAGNDTLIGNTAKTDTVGDGDIDTMAGGKGNDTYYVSDASDDVIEVVDEGNDTVNSILLTYTLADNAEILTLGGSGNISGTGNVDANTLNGNAGVNTLTGGDGVDTLKGNAGNDTLIGGVDQTTSDGDADILEGGAGNDTYYVTDESDVVKETGTAASTNGIDIVFSTVSYSLDTTADSRKIENLTMNGNGAVDGTGNDGINTIVGNDNGNTLIGLAGNDTLDGQAGADLLVGGDSTVTTDDSAVDTLKGGNGSDSYVIDSASDVVTETGDGTDIVFLNITGTTAASYTLTANVDNLVLGGDEGEALGTAPITTNKLNGTGNALANSITGNDGDNTLIGGAAGDTLTGGAGNDVLIGGTAIGVADTATDTLIGGDGNDSYYVTDTADATKEAAVATTDPVQLSIDAALDTVFATLTSGTYTIDDSSIENLTLLGTANSSATGNASANILTGNSAVNTLTGNDGDDKLDGKAGADTMVGGKGDDLYIVDNTNDVVTETNTTVNGTDLVEASATYTISDKDVENLTLTGTGAINGTGNSSNNELTGNSGSNALSGSNGNDLINGNGGKDTLTGGDDVDTFEFSLTGDSSLAAFDVISDFSFGGTDVIDLSAIDANTLSDGDQAFSLHSSGTLAAAPTVVSAANTLDYYVLAGNTFLIGDTDGTATTIEFKVQLTGFTDSLVAVTNIIL